MRKSEGKPRSSSLARLMQEIDKLDARTRRQLMQLLHTFIANSSSRQKTAAKRLA